MFIQNFSANFNIFVDSFNNLMKTFRKALKETAFSSSVPFFLICFMP